MDAQLAGDQMFAVPHLFTTDVVKEDLPTGIAPPKSMLTEPECSDCEGNDCGPNG